jgi:hypothetical protein
MTRLLLACVAMALAAGVSAQATRTNLGALTCTLSEVAEQQKAPAAEERAMRCAFKPTNAGAEMTYSGTIRQIGQGQLPGGKLVMIWVVQGPADTKLEPGLLAQTYVGAPQPIPGTPAGSALIGERNPDIVLRAETNENAPAGLVVMVMELKVLSVPA